MNREHDAVAKAIVALAAVADDDQAGGFQRLVPIVGERALERLPALGCVADAETRADGTCQSALFQVIDGARGVLQSRAIELRGLQQDAGEVLRLSVSSLVGRGDRPGYFQAGIAGELLDCIGEGLPAIFDQEADCGSMRSAAEAVVELLARAYRER